DDDEPSAESEDGYNEALDQRATTQRATKRGVAFDQKATKQRWKVTDVDRGDILQATLTLQVAEIKVELSFQKLEQQQEQQQQQRQQQAQQQAVGCGSQTSGREEGVELVLRNLGFLVAVSVLF
ncbi:unnamed protein product, partial [Polarella glacialis]